MKWYSTKDHTPIISCCCVLLAVFCTDSGNIYLELGEWDSGWKSWEYKEDIEDDCCKVMYFCYPEPIPGAYDDLMGEK